MQEKQWDRLLRRAARDSFLPLPIRQELNRQLELPSKKRSFYDEALGFLELDPAIALPDWLYDGLRAFLSGQTRTQARAWNDLAMLELRCNTVEERHQALEALHQGAKAGSLEALVNLGLAFRDGLDGVLEQDTKQAWSCFARAALFGQAHAQLELAQMMETGEGFEADWRCALALDQSVWQQMIDPALDPYLSARAALSAARILFDHPEADEEENRFELLEDARRIMEDYACQDGRMQSLSQALQALEKRLSLAPSVLN